MRPYPAVLAGKLYPRGIPTIPETQLEQYVRDNKIQLVVLAYSDVAYPEVGAHRQPSRQSQAV
jgi:predicted GTPase